MFVALSEMINLFISNLEVLQLHSFDGNFDSFPDSLINKCPLASTSEKLVRHDEPVNCMVSLVIDWNVLGNFLRRLHMHKSISVGAFPLLFVVVDRRLDKANFLFIILPSALSTFPPRPFFRCISAIISKLLSNFLFDLGTELCIVPGLLTDQILRLLHDFLILLCKDRICSAAESKSG